MLLLCCSFWILFCSKTKLFYLVSCYEWFPWSAQIIIMQCLASRKAICLHYVPCILYYFKCFDVVFVFLSQYEFIFRWCTSLFCCLFFVLNFVLHQSMVFICLPFTCDAHFNSLYFFFVFFFRFARYVKWFAVEELCKK